MIDFKKVWNKYFEESFLKRKEKLKIYNQLLDYLEENHIKISCSCLIIFSILYVFFIKFHINYLKYSFLDFIDNKYKDFITIFIFVFIAFCILIFISVLIPHIYISYIQSKKYKLLSNKLFLSEINLVQFNQFLNDVIFKQEFKIKPEYQEIVEKDLRLLSVHLKNNLINYDFNQSTLYKIFIEYINANIQIHPNYIEEKNKLANIISDLNKISSNKTKLDLSNLIKHYYYSSTPLNYFVEFEVDVAGCKTESCLNIIRDNENIIKQYKELFNNQLNMKAQI